MIQKKFLGISLKELMLLIGLLLQRHKIYHQKTKSVEVQIRYRGIRNKRD